MLLFFVVGEVQRNVNPIDRSRQELFNEYLVPKVGFDTAENESSTVCQKAVRQLDSDCSSTQDPAPYPGVMPDARPRPPREKPPPEIPEPAHFDPYDLVRMDQKPLGYH